MRKTLSVLLLPFLIGLLASVSYAESQFRQDYVKALEANNFTALEYYGKNGKTDIPIEVRALLKEAREAETFDDKMHLMDIAASMAGMYEHWHGDGKYAAEVDAFVKAEIKKETARRGEAEKWNKYELVTGNMVLRDRLEEMQAKGLAPVLFAHWVHRLVYDCRVCHPGQYPMSRPEKTLSQAKILAGKQCGTCHNGKVSFAASGNCARCHRAGVDEKDPLLDPPNYDLKKIKETAARLGSGFSPEKLKDGRFPLDRLGNIDWSAMAESGAYSPLKSIDNASIEPPRKNTIYFEPKMTFIKGVLFNHATHSSSNACAACHPGIFKDSLGSVTISMQDMSSGVTCGACHGRAAFKLADCNRCHTVVQGKPIDGVLVRKPAPAGK